MMQQKQDLINTHAVFAGRMISLSVDTVTLPNGGRVDLEIVHHPGAAAVVAIDADHNVVLVRQPRYATGGWLREVPAGKLDVGEAPEVCAARELKEEAGIVAGKLVALGKIWTSPGFTDERIWLYLATELSCVSQSLDADEVVTVERLPFDEAVREVLAGEIEDAKSVCALLRARAYLSL